MRDANNETAGTDKTIKSKANQINTNQIRRRSKNVAIDLFPCWSQTKSLWLEERGWPSIACNKSNSTLGQLLFPPSAHAHAPAHGGPVDDDPNKRLSSVIVGWPTGNIQNYFGRHSKRPGSAPQRASPHRPIETVGSVCSFALLLCFYSTNLLLRVQSHWIQSELTLKPTANKSLARGRTSSRYNRERPSDLTEKFNFRAESGRRPDCPVNFLNKKTKENQSRHRLGLRALGRV